MHMNIKQAIFLKTEFHFSSNSIVNKDINTYFEIIDSDSDGIASYQEVEKGLKIIRYLFYYFYEVPCG